MSPREETNPGFVPPAQPGDFLQLTPTTQTLELYRMFQAAQNAPPPTNGFWGGFPPWVRVAALLFAGGSIPAGILTMLPFETKDSAKGAHEALQAQIEALRTDLPADIVKALDVREEKKRGRR